MKIMLPVFMLFLASCATVGPVEVTQDDTFFTVGIAFLVAILFLFLKSYIEYFFSKKLEKYKKKLDKE